jgi:NitT/TauT family transport system substrate-binding protein
MRYKIFLVLIFLLVNLNAQEKLRVGVLSYGTVNWGLEILKQNGLDKKNGFDLEIVKLASKNAQLISLQAKKVDLIVNDWIWVNKEKSKGKNFLFYPYSKALGTLMIKKESEINTLDDLKGKELGISGGTYDKTWLLFRAYYKKMYGGSLKNIVKPVFASPPILFRKMKDNSLTAAINFWHFNAKLPEEKFKPLINIDEILKNLGINGDISFVGWVFNEDFALKNRNLINSFLKASLESKEMLNSDDKQWDKIKNLVKVKDNKIFESLKKEYKKGIVKEFTKDDITELKKVYEILSSEAGANYISKDVPFDKTIFWLK